ncbi:beta-parvin isoform X1 [Nycticebus coucang]|uniref:beta-parvin isoform X1 n=1 Tax=Nycticebus coucang TaxID=9470 RepID=UPI00234E2E3E|nr:beta-parvin isoform X1 [Nycticebus coucang]
MSDLQEEGKNAINSPMSPALVNTHPTDTQLEENEERTMIDPNSKDDPKFKELVKVLLDWINDVLVEERIIVKQLEEDLYDGQVLQKLLEKLAGCKLNVAEVTQSEIGQKQKLQTVLEAVHDLLRPHGWVLRWNVDSIHGKNLVAILHLLVSLAMHFRAPIRLPEHVSVQVVVVRKREGLLHSSHISEELTTTTEMMMGRFERDAFDTLFDHAPDKLSVVKKSLITFVNKHLNKLNLEVTELETQEVCDSLLLEAALDSVKPAPRTGVSALSAQQPGQPEPGGRAGRAGAVPHPLRARKVGCCQDAGAVWGVCRTVCRHFSHPRQGPHRHFPERPARRQPEHLAL